MSDPLSIWWVHAVTIERYIGDGAEGKIYAAPEPLMGFVRDSRKLVRNTESEQVLSTRAVFLPISTGLVPGRSRVTYAGDTRTVISSAEHSAGELPVPAHVEVMCE